MSTIKNIAIAVLIIYGLTPVVVCLGIVLCIGLGKVFGL